MWEEMNIFTSMFTKNSHVVEGILSWLQCSITRVLTILLSTSKWIREQETHPISAYRPESCTSDIIQLSYLFILINITQPQHVITCCIHKVDHDDRSMSKWNYLVDGELINDHYIHQICWDCLKCCFSFCGGWFVKLLQGCTVASKIVQTLSLFLHTLFSRTF